MPREHGRGIRRRNDAGLRLAIRFYLNIRTGGPLVRRPIAVDDLEDVTERTMSLLMWGKTFAIGALVNSLLAAVAAYFVFLLLFQRVRAPALLWLRGRIRRRRTLPAHL